MFKKCVFQLNKFISFGIIALDSKLICTATMQKKRFTAITLVVYVTPPSFSVVGIHHISGSCCCRGSYDHRTLSGVAMMQ